MALSPGEKRGVTSETGRCLIIGYGNPLRGDDALGPAVARRLAERFAGDPRIDVLVIHQLTLDLAETIADHERLLLIDAADEVAPGELVDRPVLPGDDLPQPFSHYLAPAELLGIALALYGACPETRLLGLGAATFDPIRGGNLSGVVTAALPTLFDRIVEHVGGTPMNPQT